MLQCRPYSSARFPQSGHLYGPDLKGRPSDQFSAARYSVGVRDLMSGEVVVHNIACGVVNKLRRIHLGILPFAGDGRVPLHTLRGTIRVLIFFSVAVGPRRAFPMLSFSAGVTTVRSACGIVSEAVGTGRAWHCKLHSLAH